MRISFLSKLIPGKIKAYALSAVWLLSGIIMQGCVYDGIEECPQTGGERYNIRFEYSGYGTYHPENMALLLFRNSDINDNGKWRFDFPSGDPSFFLIPEGEYQLLSFNDDSSRMYFRNTDSFSDFEIYCGETDLVESRCAVQPSRSVADQKVCMTPTPLWCASARSVLFKNNLVSLIPPSPPNSTSADTLIIRPDMVLANYTVIVNNVSNTDGVAGISGSLSGMAEGICVSDLRHSDIPVILPFSLAKSNDDSYKGSFLTFGLTSGSNSVSTDNILQLLIRFKDGKKGNYQFNVSSQTHWASDPKNVTVVIDSLPLPPHSPVEGDAFDVSVDSWEDEIINIVI